MRERTKLASQVEAVRALERERQDTLEFAELAEMEGDQASLEEAAQTLKALKERAGRPSLRRCCPARRTPTTPMWRSTPAPAAPSRPIGP